MDCKPSSPVKATDCLKGSTSKHGPYQKAMRQGVCLLHTD